MESLYPTQVGTQRWFWVFCRIPCRGKPNCGSSISPQGVSTPLLNHPRPRLPLAQPFLLWDWLQPSCSCVACLCLSCLQRGQALTPLGSVRAVTDPHPLPCGVRRSGVEQKCCFSCGLLSASPKIPHTVLCQESRRQSCGEIPRPPMGGLDLPGEGGSCHLHGALPESDLVTADLCVASSSPQPMLP